MADNISTITNVTLSSSSSIIVILNIIQARFVVQLPLIFTILGLIGFIGNAITFLQPALRSNTCCIYTFSGSVVDIINILTNLFPSYLINKYQLVTFSQKVPILCKLYIYFLGFFPQLAINLLVLSVIDQFACTCGLTSPMRRVNQMKMAPWMIGITVVVTCLTSIRAIILYDVIPGEGCVASQLLLNSFLYIIFNGALQPVMMLLLMLFTYRNIIHSRQRVVRMDFFLILIFLKKSFCFFVLGCKKKKSTTKSIYPNDFYSSFSHRFFSVTMDFYVRIFRND
jgi:hypothetical protein